MQNDEILKKGSNVQVPRGQEVRREVGTMNCIVPSHREKVSRRRVTEKRRNKRGGPAEMARRVVPQQRAAQTKPGGAGLTFVVKYDNINATVESGFVGRE